MTKDTKGPEVHRGEILLSGYELDMLRRQVNPQTDDEHNFMVPFTQIRRLIGSIDYQASVIRDLNNKIDRLENQIVELQDHKPDLDEDFIP
jgi:hypothetical protein